MLSIVLLAGISVFVLAQTQVNSTNASKTSVNESITPNKVVPKIIVMVNSASWCPVCQANGSRVEKNVISQYMNNNKYQIVVNDLSNAETVAKSKISCKKAGIEKVAETNTGTGTIYFINNKTKQIVAQISVSKSDEEIKEAFNSSLKKA